jgi:hypothetical protein
MLKLVLYDLCHPILGLSPPFKLEWRMSLERVWQRNGRFRYDADNMLDEACNRSRSS